MSVPTAQRRVRHRRAAPASSAPGRSPRRTSARRSEAGAVRVCTSTWFSSSQRTSRSASASERCPAPTGITNAVGYSTIQLWSFWNGAAQHAGRAAPVTPRRDDLQRVPQQRHALVRQMAQRRVDHDLALPLARRGARRTRVARARLVRRGVKPRDLAVDRREVRRLVVQALGHVRPGPRPVRAAARSQPGSDPRSAPVVDRPLQPVARRR